MAVSQWRIGPWRVRDVLFAAMGLIVGAELGSQVAGMTFRGWIAFGAFAAYSALFLVFAWLRPRYRPMFLGAFVGLAVTVTVLVLFVSG